MPSLLVRLDAAQRRLRPAAFAVAVLAQVRGRPGRLSRRAGVVLRVPRGLPAAAGARDRARDRAQRPSRRAAERDGLGAGRLPGDRHAAAREHPLARRFRLRAGGGPGRHRLGRTRAERLGAGGLQRDLVDPADAPSRVRPAAGARSRAARRHRGGRAGHRGAVRRVRDRRRSPAVAGNGSARRPRPLSMQRCSPSASGSPSHARCGCASSSGRRARRPSSGRPCCPWARTWWRTSCGTPRSSTACSASCSACWRGCTCRRVSRSCCSRRTVSGSVECGRGRWTARCWWTATAAPTTPTPPPSSVAPACASPWTTTRPPCRPPPPLSRSPRPPPRAPRPLHPPCPCHPPRPRLRPPLRPGPGRASTPAMSVAGGGCRRSGRGRRPGGRR